MMVDVRNWYLGCVEKLFARSQEQEETELKVRYNISLEKMVTVHWNQISMKIVLVMAFKKASIFM